jgi:hypothetical protein
MPTIEANKFIVGVQHVAPSFFSSISINNIRAKVYFRFVGKPISNLSPTILVDSSPEKLTPMPRKSYKMFFQNVTHLNFVLSIMEIDLDVGMQGFALFIFSHLNIIQSL